MRLPARVSLPFGYRVTVRLVTDAEMAALLHPDEELCDGLWLAGPRSISIRKVLPKARQRYMLSHELGHAFLDWQHHYLNNPQVMNP